MSTSIGFYGHHRLSAARKARRERELIKRYGQCQCATEPKPAVDNGRCVGCNGRA